MAKLRTDLSQRGISEAEQIVVELICERKSDAEIVDRLASDGISAIEATQTIRRVVASLPNREPFRAIRMSQTSQLIKTYRLLAEIGDQKSVDARDHSISRNEFLNDYYKINRPLHLKGPILGWAHRESWQPSALRANFGSSRISVMRKRRSDIVQGAAGSECEETMSLASYLDLIETSGASNEAYMVARNRNLDEGLAAARNLLPPLNNLIEDSNDGFSRQLWIGPAGTITRLHRDSGNVILTQIYGRKNVRIISPIDAAYLYTNDDVFSLVDPDAPDLERFPLFSRAKVYELTLEPEDAIFIPVGWWHDIRSLTLSISVGYTTFGVRNDFSDARKDEAEIARDESRTNKLTSSSGMS